MLIIDLEWNRGYDHEPLDEILQIGAVKVDRLGGPIRDTFDIYIRPRVHKSFGPGAKELPDLRRSLESQVDFPAALDAFLAWCGEETEAASWGGDDLRTLSKSCAYWGLPIPMLRQSYDLQCAFGHLVGAQGQQVALWRAVAYCRIPEPFSFHNALNDAVYTAAVAEWLREEDLAYRPEPKPARGKQGKLPRFAQEPFPPQPRRRLGPFPTRESALDAKTARRNACPFCGAKSWVHQWWKDHGEQYYASFSCREHGRFLCRLTLQPMEDGTWRGRSAVPAVTPELLAAYRRARSGSLYACRSVAPKRKRRRRGERHSAGG